MSKPSEAPRIIIKRKVGHSAHHGGAWKVAYADFVTAMMALFMVLWLLTQADVKLRSQIAQYFRNPGILPGGAMVSEGKTEPAHSSDPSVVEENIVLVHTGQLRKREGEAAREQKRLENQAQAIEQAIRKAGANDEALKALGDQVIVEVRETGLSIEVIDQGRDPTLLFDLSSSELKPPLVWLLKKVAVVLGELPNPVQVGGHTDSRPYPAASAKTNWMLSFERADNARRVLETSGLRPRQVKRVLAFADSEPLNIADPLADENRRLSILAERTVPPPARVGGSGKSPVVLPPDEIPGRTAALDAGTT